MKNVTGSASFVVTPQNITSMSGGTGDVPSGVRRRLRAAATRAESKSELLSEVARFIEASCDCAGILYVNGTGSDSTLIWLKHAHHTSDAVKGRIEQASRTWCKVVCKEGTHRIDALADIPGIVAVSVPVGSGRQVDGALVVLHPLVHQSTEHLSLLLDLAAAHIELWLANQQRREVEFEASAAAALIELVSKMETARDFKHACYTLVNELQSYLGCQRVAVGVCREGKRQCRLQAISGLSAFEASSELARTIESALDESVARNDLTVWPPRCDSQRHGLLVHKKLASVSDAQCVVSSPLRDEAGVVRGAWVFLASEEFRNQHERLNFIVAAERRIASSLRLLKQAEPGRVSRLVGKVRASVRTRKGAAVSACLATLLVALIVPVPHRVKCACELQPVARRYVSAPFDGALEKSFVEPGDLVTAGQLLAKMDGREIRWKRAGVEADYNRASKERDSHLAGHDVGAAQLSKFEMDRLRLDKRLLEHRSDRLEIKSPIDGIVVSGNLKRAEGAPLTVGQTLFEVAPLDKMLVEAAIPEDEIAHVQTGREVSISLDAYPGKHWQGRVERILPRAEIRDNEQVFIAEVLLDNRNDLLRPGMRGRAKIAGRRRALGWVLFHKPWEQLVLRLGW